MKISNVKNQVDFLKGPFQIGVDITNKCNYRCKHCYNSSGDNIVLQNELSDSEFLELFEDIANMQVYNVCLCGGEPLLKKELIYDIANLLHRKGIPHISMVTNGYFLTEDVARKLMDSNLNRIQFSLDGSNPESCSKLRLNSLAFERVIRGLKILQDLNFPQVDIAFCPTKFNIKELDGVCKIAVTYGVKEVRIQPLMEIGRATKFSEEILPSKKDYVELIKSINKLRKEYRSITITWGDPLDHIFRYKDILKHTDVFTTIRANGDLAPSPYIPLIVGNIKHHKFSDYWDNGLGKVWSSDILQELANKITCMSDMRWEIEDIPTPWLEEEIEMDLIDDKLINLSKVNV